MIKKLFLLLTFCSFLLLSSCGYNKTDLSKASSKTPTSSAYTSHTTENSSSNVSDNNHTNSRSSTKGTKTKKYRKNNSSDSSKTKKYYGTWVVTKQIELPREIGNLTSSEAQDLIGKTIIIQSNEFVWLNGIKYKNPLYSETTLNDYQFYVGWKVHLDEVGIPSNSVTEVEVYKNNTDNINNDTGKGFGIFNNDTLYVNVKGQFFILKKNWS